MHYIGGSKGLMYLGGKLVIDQNTCTNNSSKNNLYVAGNYYPQIKSTCVLTDGSKIGIFAKLSSGETELPVVYIDSTLSASDYLQYFYSDSTDYVTYADTENCAISLKYQHSHNFSESKICSCGVYSSDGGTTLFTEFSKSLLVSGALATGNYYLASDITLSSAIKIQSSANVKIALNGKTLNLGEKFSKSC